MKTFSLWIHLRFKLRHTYALWLPVVTLAHLLLPAKTHIKCVHFTLTTQVCNSMITVCCNRFNCAHNTDISVSRASTIRYYLDTVLLLFMICKHVLPLLTGKSLPNGKPFQSLVSSVFISHQRFKWDFQLRLNTVMQISNTFKFCRHLTTNCVHH